MFQVHNSLATSLGAPRADSKTSMKKQIFGM